MDIIHIKNLEIFANHGVFEEENRLGQKFIINADLYTDFDKTEDLSKSIDYGMAAGQIADFLQKNTYKLIETAAQCLAEHLLLNTENLKQVHIELKKPWAPLKFSMETVSVELTRGWHKVYLSIGSNMGNREKYLENAYNALYGNKSFRSIKISPIYETEPYGGVEQQNFLNCCVELETILEPMELLEYLHRIEADNGRVRDIHWGPRTLDMDILLYDDVVMHDRRLCIPHIDMHNRMFVLKPLCDIAPYAYHPVKHATAQELLKLLTDDLKNN